MALRADLEIAVPFSLHRNAPAHPVRSPGAEPGLQQGQGCLLLSHPAPTGDTVLTKASNLKFESELGVRKSKSPHLWIHTQESCCSGMGREGEHNPLLTPAGTISHLAQPQAPPQSSLGASVPWESPLNWQCLPMQIRPIYSTAGMHNSPGQSQPVASKLPRSLKAHLCNWQPLKSSSLGAGSRAGGASPDPGI